MRLYYYNKVEAGAAGDFEVAGIYDDDDEREHGVLLLLLLSHYLMRSNLRSV